MSAPDTTLRPTASPIAFVRDKATWLAYLACWYYLVIQASFGPAMPYIREERGFSYTMAGLHFTAISTGAAAVGLLGDRLIRLLGRRRAFWLAISGMTLGSMLVILSPVVALGIAGAFVAGALGCLLLIVAQANLADRHPAHRPQAMAEINLACSAATIVAAFGVGVAAGMPGGWRFAFVLFWGAAGIAALTLRSAPFAPGMPRAIGHDGPVRLSPVFWALAIAQALSAATEWSITYWGADFLIQSVALSKGGAATALSTFFFAMATGRLLGSRYASRIAPGTLLPVSIAIGLSAFPIFWLGPTLPIKLAGLFLIGIGLSNVYPATASLTTERWPTIVDVTLSRLLLVSGISMLVAPLLLGMLADRIGVERGLALIVPILVASLAITFWVRRRLLAPEPSTA